MLRVPYLFGVLFLLSATSGKIYHYIKPTPNFQCPEQAIDTQCYTLSQYASKPHGYFFDETLQLIFLPGHHFLDSELRIGNISNLAMYSRNNNYQSVTTITCSSSARIFLYNTSYVKIIGLAFLQCVHNIVFSVEQFIFENCSLQGYGVKLGIDLRSITFAKISSSYFSSYIDDMALQAIMELERQSGAILTDTSSSLITKRLSKIDTTNQSSVIFIWNCTITVEDCEFVKNELHNGSVLSIEDTLASIDRNVFLNNTCIGENANGCALSAVKSTISVDSSRFINQISTAGGALYYNYSTVMIKNSVFINNTADDGGAVTFESSTVNLTNTSLIGNTANLYGGAIVVQFSSINIAGTKFINNTAAVRGGAMILAHTTTTVTIEESHFFNNTATDSGGAMFAIGCTIIANNVEFSFNAASTSGGAVFIQSGTLLLQYSEFSHNVVGHSGGAVWIADSKISMRNCTILKNKVMTVRLPTSPSIGSYGGAIVALDTDFTVRNCNFTANAVEISFLVTANSLQTNESRVIITSIYASGGAVFFLGANTILINSKFVYNSATINGVFDDKRVAFQNIMSVGGAINVVDSTVAMRNISMLENKANVHLKIVNATFLPITNNIVALGGAISTSNGTLSIISGSFFQNNVCTDIVSIALLKTPPESRGGAILSQICTINIVDCDFVTNSASSSFRFINRAKTDDANVNALNSSTQAHDGSLPGQTFASASGAIHLPDNIMITVTGTKFINNTAMIGGAVYITAMSEDSRVTFTNDVFLNNTALFGGALAIFYSSANLSNSSFLNNNVTGTYSSLNIKFITYLQKINSTDNLGAGIAVVSSIIRVYNCSFIANINTAAIFLYSTAYLDSNVYIDNKGYQSGAILVFFSIFQACDSVFIGNKCTILVDIENGGPGAISFINSDVRLCNTTFINNTAGESIHSGGAVSAVLCSLSLEECIFINNSANTGGAIGSSCTAMSQILTDGIVENLNDTHYRGEPINILNKRICSLTLKNCTFFNNTAVLDGSALYISSTNFTSSGFLIIQGNNGTSTLIASNCTLQLNGYVTVSQNNGSLIVYSSTVTVTGYINIRNNSVQLSELGIGTLSMHQSEIFFSDTVVCTFEFNEAKNSFGGAISAVESKIHMDGYVNITHNVALTGGGIYAFQSEVNTQGNTMISKNEAIEKGGGIHAVSSTTKLLGGSLVCYNNTAEKGGGMCLELNSKLYVIKASIECQDMTVYQIVYFTNTAKPTLSVVCNSNKIMWLRLEFTYNSADYGGALYITDDTNSGTCAANTTVGLTSNQCFFQVLAAYDNYFYPVVIPNLLNTFFVNNSARLSGGTIFGGLLDRCVVSPYSEVRHRHITPVNGLSYLTDYNVTNLHDKVVRSSVSSYPVRVCFCHNNQPDCTYVPPMMFKKKGKTFRVSVVAVDQVNNVIPNSIVHSVLSSQSGLSAGQSIQYTGDSCTELKYTIMSQNSSEKITLYAEGPCKDLGISATNFNITFKPCPIGFQDSVSECICDPRIYTQYITNCSIEMESLLTKDNVWISYINVTDQEGFLTYPYCPFDYCQPSTERGWINFNLATASNKQCAFNRSGKLCGSCEDGLSITLGSSRCMHCSNAWLVLLVPFIIAGVILVTFLIACSLTVSVGTVNGFIFYANVIAASRAIFLPNETQNILTIFIAWLNLDFGFETCFFDGMDGYFKIWLQLVFPLYVLFLVVTIIIASDHSEKLTRLLLDRNPVSTLSTLILLSYAKLIRTIILILSYATLEYPDGTHERVLLFDANVKFFSWKHIPLLISGLLILLVGLTYTFILFFWQWLVYCPKMKIAWITNSKLYPFIDAYHAPYNPRYRFWTGFLLFARAILYLVSALNVQHDPKIKLLSVTCIVTLILLVSTSTSTGGVYKEWPKNILENSFYFNIIIFAAATFYVREAGGSQIAVAYTSISIAFLTFLVVFMYHTYKYVLKKLFRTIKLTCCKDRPINVQHALVEDVGNGLLSENECTCTEVNAIPLPVDTDGNIIEPEMDRESKQIENQKDVYLQPTSDTSNHNMERGNTNNVASGTEAQVALELQSFTAHSSLRTDQIELLQQSQALEENDLEIHGNKELHPLLKQQCR